MGNYDKTHQHILNVAWKLFSKHVFNENSTRQIYSTCGIEIGIRRLEARPTAELCIDCKTLDEIKERQYGS